MSRWRTDWHRQMKNEQMKNWLAQTDKELTEEIVVWISSVTGTISSAVIIFTAFSVSTSDTKSFDSTIPLTWNRNIIVITTPNLCSPALKISIGHQFINECCVISEGLFSVHWDPSPFAREPKVRRRRRRRQCSCWNSGRGESSARYLFGLHLEKRYINIYIQYNTIEMEGLW